jgi:hypothetical protein
VTVNEPNSLCLATYYLKVFPRGPGRGGARDLSRALAGILTAHVLARRALREGYLEAGWPEPVVTYSAWACAVYAVDRYLVDLLRPATRAHTRELRRVFRRDLGRVGVVGRLADLVLTRAVKPAAFAPLIAELGKDEDALDVLAFDYYHPFLGDYLGWTGPKKHPWEWPARPERMPAFTEAWLGPHRGVPLYVLETASAPVPSRAADTTARIAWGASRRWRARCRRSIAASSAGSASPATSTGRWSTTTSGARSRRASASTPSITPPARAAC